MRGAVKAEPTLREKVADLKCLGEVSGFRDQLEKEGRMTPEIDNLLRLRAAELERKP